MFNMADVINEQISNSEISMDIDDVKVNGDVSTSNTDDADVEMEDLQLSEVNDRLVGKACMNVSALTNTIISSKEQNYPITNGHISERKVDDANNDIVNESVDIESNDNDDNITIDVKNSSEHSKNANSQNNESLINGTEEVDNVNNNNSACNNVKSCETTVKNLSSENDIDEVQDLSVTGLTSTKTAELYEAENGVTSLNNNVKLDMEVDNRATDNNIDDISLTKDDMRNDETNYDCQNEDDTENDNDVKDDDDMSDDKNKKSSKKPYAPSISLTAITPRRSSRNLNKQKNYAEKDNEETDNAGSNNKSFGKSNNDDDDIEEVIPTDPLADDPKIKNQRTAITTMTHKPIVVSDTKGLVEFANSKQLKTNKKEPTLVIIDTNSILSGRGPVPITQCSSSGASQNIGITSSSSSHGSYTTTTTIRPNTTIQPIPYTSSGIGSSSSSSAHQIVYSSITTTPTNTTSSTPIRNPPQMKPLVIAPVQTTTIVSSTVPTCTSTSNSVNVSSTTPKAPVILPSLTDDMFVVEAPSFIVPYVYEKPPMQSLKKFVGKLDQELTEAKKKNEAQVAASTVTTTTTTATVSSSSSSTTEKNETEKTSGDKQVESECAEVKVETDKSKEQSDVTTNNDKSLETNEKREELKTDENEIKSESSQVTVKPEIKVEYEINDELLQSSIEKMDVEEVDDEKKENLTKPNKKSNDVDNDTREESDSAQDKQPVEEKTTAVKTTVVEFSSDENDKKPSKDVAIVEDLSSKKDESQSNNNNNNKEIEQQKSDASSAIDKSKKPLSHSYFENPLGKFFIQIGLNLVQEHVQTDLLRSQKRKRDKEGASCSEDVHAAIDSLSKTLEFSKENNDPFKLNLKKCELCSFKTESILAMTHHLETPHMKNYTYRCNFCSLEVRSPHDILFHMEAEHNVRGRLERAPAFHQCPNCQFEDNQKGKLTRHLVSCVKKFRPERNQEPPLDWEPPAKIPRVTRNRPPTMSPGNAVYQAAISGMKQVQQNSLLPKLMPAPNNVPVSFVNKNRPKPPVNFINNRFPSPPTVQPNNFQQRGMSGQQTINQSMMFRSGTNAQTQVLLPTNYPMGGAHIYPNTQNMKQSQQQQQGMATSKLLQQPSISITPLPRQSNVPSSSSPSTSMSPNVMSSTAKPGRPQPTGSNGKGNTFVICEICDGYIKDLEQLRNHMQWIHKVKIHPKMIYNRPPLNCQKCQFRFFTDQGLERHLLGSHGLVTSSMQEAANKGKDGGRCPVCGRVYQWKLLNHVARDHNMSLKPAHLSYKCTVCTATFGMYKQFESHVYSAHSVVAKRAIENKKSSMPPPATVSTAAGPSGANTSSQNDTLLKPLKINDEITIIPQPARGGKVTNMKLPSSNTPTNLSAKTKV